VGGGAWGGCKKKASGAKKPSPLKRQPQGGWGTKWVVVIVFILSVSETRVREGKGGKTMTSSTGSQKQKNESCDKPVLNDQKEMGLCLAGATKGNPLCGFRGERSQKKGTFLKLFKS